MRHIEGRGNGLERTARPDLYPNLAVKLTTNPTMDNVKYLLETMPPDWPRLFERARQLDFPHDDLSQVRGVLGALHTRSVVEHAASLQSVPGIIRLDPIESGTGSKNYNFRRDGKGAYTMRDKNKRRFNIVGDLDVFFTADGVPVVCEVKTTQRRNKGKHGQGRGWLKALDEADINRTFKPLQEYYKDPYGIDEFGYIVVGPAEVVDPFEEHERQFEDHNGIVATFQTSYEDFDAQAQEFINQTPELTPVG